MAGYTLRLSDFERMRFRMMATLALQKEGDLWERAGIAKGARVVDLGCGPGAGLCTEDDIARWDAFLRRREEAGGGGYVVVPNFTVLARRP